MLRIVRDYLALTKPRINLTVLLTAYVGYCVAAGGHTASWRMIGTLLGTALTVAGACAINCYQEIEVDARMERTRDRPLPDRRLAPGSALTFGLGLSAGGVGVLALGVNLLSAALALTALLLYTPLYTLLKPRTSLSTLVGAVPGALPPVIGWAGATGRVDPAALALFGILFVWQPPHFLALALCRESEYERAGLSMLPREVGRTGSLRQISLYATVLLPLTLTPVLFGLAGSTYFLGALLLGSGFVVASLSGFWLEAGRLRRWARGLFSYSILYLAGLFGLLLWHPAAG